MTKFLGLCPALTALDLMVFWGRGQQAKERDSLPETDSKEDLSRLLGLWFRAIEATQQSGLPHFSSVKPHQAFRPTLGSSQMGFCSCFEKVFAARCPHLSAQSSPPGTLSPFLLSFPGVPSATLMTPTPGFSSPRVWAATVIHGMTRAVSLPSQITQQPSLEGLEGWRDLPGDAGCKARARESQPALSLSLLLVQPLDSIGLLGHMPEVWQALSRVSSGSRAPQPRKGGAVATTDAIPLDTSAHLSP